MYKYNSEIDILLKRMLHQLLDKTYSPADVEKFYENKMNMMQKIETIKNMTVTEFNQWSDNHLIV